MIRPKAFLRAMEIADPHRWPGMSPRHIMRIRAMLSTRRARAHDALIAHYRAERARLGLPHPPASSGYEGGAERYRRDPWGSR